jgi:lipopolysaccharide transport system permease protein
MTVASNQPPAADAPRPTVVVAPSRGWVGLQLRALWRYRELLYFLTWRDIKIRYKQTLLGVTWVLLQPIINMLIFSGLFGVLLNAPSGGVPYPLFVYAGMLPWQYFAGALNKSSTSLVDSANLVTKVYFPRLIIPLTGVLSGLVDFAISFGVLLVLMAWYRMPLTATALWLPLLLLAAILTALAFGLWFAALNVRYRDVRYVVPYLVQAWMFLTPVVYSVVLIPEQYRWLMGLNPMTGVVEGFRWALLGDQLAGAAAPGPVFAVSILITLVVLVSGAAYFRHTERTFADII